MKREEFLTRILLCLAILNKIWITTATCTCTTSKREIIPASGIRPARTHPSNYANRRRSYLCSFVRSSSIKTYVKPERYGLVFGRVGRVGQARKHSMLTVRMEVPPYLSNFSKGTRAQSSRSSSRRSLLSYITASSWIGAVMNNPSFAFATESTIDNVGGENLSSSSVQPTTKKPWAPTDALLPATRVRLLLNQAIDLAKDLTTTNQSSITRTSETISPTQRHEHTKALLSRLDSILASPPKASEIKPNKSIRIAFNTYTAYLRYDDEYTLTASPVEKKKMIREDRMPDVKQVITADLDLRDLYRNEVLTNVDEARAELRYEIDEFEKGNDTDCEELLHLLKCAGDACNDWFSLISEEDVKEAQDIVMNAEFGS